MNLTIANWATLFVIAIACIIVAIYISSGICDKVADFYIFIATLAIGVILIISVLVMNWYNTQTANGQRKYKTFQSNINGGIERTVDVYSMDNELIYHYQGKIDIEDESQAYCIWFESEEGLRTIIHYGIADRVIIEEVGK